MNKRIAAMTELIKKAKIAKIAEEISTDENLASIENPNEYAHKVFEALLSKIVIDGIDD